MMFLRPAIFLGVAMLLLAAGPSGAQQSDVTKVYGKALETVIAPAYDRFSAAARVQRETTRDLCENPGSQTLAAARTAFDETATAWAGIELFRFGAVMEENRLERVLFYPDRKSIGLRQTQGLLAEGDETALDAAALPQKSVAVQGLGALEFTLFGTGSDELSQSTGNSYRCRFAFAISRNLQTIATELASAWAGDGAAAARWLALGNAPSDDSRVAVETLLSTQVHSLEAIRDIRLRRFLGKEGERSFPKRALFWRSQMTMPVIAGNLAFLDALFTGGGMAELLPEQVRDGVESSIRFEFAQALSTARALDGSVAALVGNADSLAKLRYLELLLGSLIERFDVHYSAAVGISAGFSFADGD